MARATKASTRVRSFIEGKDEIAGVLPLVHITDAYRFLELADGTSIDPTTCRVFGEPLVYFFYGRPAYKTKRSGSLPLSYDLPVALIFKPEFSLSQIRRIFPFDTGAFHDGLYKPYFHPDSQISDFELDANMSSVKRLLGTFYTTGEEYMTGRSTRNIDIPATAFEVAGLHELSRAPANPIKRDGDLDERASSVEVQTSRSVDVRGNILAVIAPNILFEDKAAAEFISKSGAKIITYESLMATSTETFAAIIYDKVITLYREEGLLK